MTAVLRNPKYELMAQGLVRGLSKEEAYKNAGFGGDPKRNARVVAARPLVQRRVRELLQNAASRAELSRAKILERIYDDWETARKLGQMPAALKAAEMMGKELHRMFVERKEVGGPGDFDNKSEEELRQIVQEGIKELGWDKDSNIPPSSSIN